MWLPNPNNAAAALTFRSDLVSLYHTKVKGRAKESLINKLFNYW